ncbi:hypothetical protein C8F01DRAFT_1117533 [Mycena amicta]|nr:hypothetical protein C8F01DRAFT_1117533 [Mycena amicta]
MSKRALTESAHQARVQTSIHPSTPTDLALKLQNIGSRVRKNVTEGYATQRHTSTPPSPTKPPSAQSGIFTPAIDILRDVFASAPTQPPAPSSPRKRQHQEDQDASDSEDRSMAVDSVIERPIKPKPRRLMQTRSLPSNLFGSAETIAEDDWSVEISPRPPTEQT